MFSRSEIYTIEKYWTDYEDHAQTAFNNADLQSVITADILIECLLQYDEAVYTDRRKKDGRYIINT